MIRISNKKILLIAGWIVYASFMLSKRFGVVYHPLIQGYFSDFMAVPLMLGVILLLMRVSFIVIVGKPTKSLYKIFL